MRLRSLLAMPELRLEVVTGADELDRVIRWVVTTDLLDPGRYLRGRELVLTGLVWRTGPADSETFVRALTEAGVSGLAAWDLALGAIPDDLVDACRRHRLPLFKVPEDVAFATVTEEVVRNLSGARAADLAAVLDRHRRLVEGTGLGAVVDLVGRCHVLTPTGRVVAGPVPPDPAGLARAFLTAPRLPHHVPALGATLFAVAGGGTPRVADWFIAFEGDAADWPAERRALTAELAAIVALERARSDTPADGELVAAVAAGDVSRLPGVRHVAVAASGRGGLRPAELRAVLAEVLGEARGEAHPAVGVLDGEAVALVPEPDRDVAALLQDALDFLAPASPARASRPASAAPPRRPACAPPSRRPGTRAGSPPPAPHRPASSGTTSWPPTSCCWPPCRTTSAGCSGSASWTRCATTTGRTAPTSSAPWRPSSGTRAPGRAARSSSTCT